MDRKPPLRCHDCDEALTDESVFHVKIDDEGNTTNTPKSHPQGKPTKKEHTIMKTTVTFLILLTLFPLTIFAQDYTQWGLPDGAKMRLGKGSDT